MNVEARGEAEQRLLDDRAERADRDRARLFRDHALSRLWIVDTLGLEDGDAALFGEVRNRRILKFLAASLRPRGPRDDQRRRMGRVEQLRQNGRGEVGGAEVYVAQCVARPRTKPRSRRFLQLRA